jgi:hypothetical protein
MSEEMRSQLEHLRRDYTAVEGKPFAHFFCPMLLKDENVELCMGHVVNDSIPNSSGVRVVQREDVDGWFGRVFEPDFVTLLEARAADRKDAVFNERLSKQMKPRIVVDGKDCPYYIHRGTAVPPDHTGIQLEHTDGEAIKLVLKKPPDEFSAERTRRWQIVVERDCRITALVSLIKAGYLTLFRMLGYSYALSAAGMEVGHNMDFPTNGGHPVKGVQSPWEVPQCRAPDARTPPSSRPRPSDSSPSRATRSPRPPAPSASARTSSATGAAPSKPRANMPSPVAVSSPPSGRRTAASAPRTSACWRSATS